MSSSARSHGGFTVIELMIVVALIGILASIASANYSKFASKARRVEASLALSAAYVAEQAFAAEAGSFTGCLRSIGYEPEGFSTGAGGGRGNRYYTVGIHDADMGLGICGIDGVSPCDQTRWSAGAPSCGVGNGVNYFRANVRANTINPLPGSGQINLVDTTVEQHIFRIAAIGAISTSPANASAYDVWIIDNDRVLNNTVSMP